MPLTLVMILHVLVSIALIALVMMQRGKGSEMGALGAGASGTMFGSQGATPFMVKFVAGLAVIFFCTTLGLNYLVSSTGSKKAVDLLDLGPGPVIPNAPINKNNNQGLQEQQSQTMPQNKK